MPNGITFELVKSKFADLDLQYRESCRHRTPFDSIRYDIPLI